MDAKNTPRRLCPHIEDRDIERKEFRDQFNRELAERKSWDEEERLEEQRRKMEGEASKDERDG
ncbi:uncharacterized protein TrAtP1_001264 [Trichoderma atroviride]|uniref:uncharacterized protein n=1 Tax=Hypocrea atroviridis TaxID=63577 RepID=UPI00332B6F40|nr:hypothetical protein TrAtP1_001264 [Trichoderma atroviride]